MNEFDDFPKVYYHPSKWVEHSNYYSYVETEPEIKGDLLNFTTVGVKQSKKCRVTGHIVNSCINNYSDKVIMVKKIAGIYNEELTVESKERINHGLLYENSARIWYENVTGYKVKPPYFAVYKKDHFLGAEHDGFVYTGGTRGTGGAERIGGTGETECDGIIEIKCPLKMYESIVNYNKQEKSDYHHIPESHYDQMQMEMEIFNKNWCDYIVFCISENKVHLERVFRDTYHWKVMYEKIEIFVNSRLKPFLLEIASDYPYNPSNELKIRSK